jgi:hypothetical protein
MSDFQSTQEIIKKRYESPQEVIDFLLKRKDEWKSFAIKQEEKVKHCLKLLEAAKAKIKEENKMKQWWKYTTYIGAGLSAALIIVLISVCWTVAAIVPRYHQYQPNDVPKVPVSGKLQKTPNFILASVNIYNGSLQGSGTVISKGEKYAAILTAAHNFKGKIGGPFWVYYADGTYTKATLLAIDRERDLALGKVDANTVLGHTYIPKTINEGILSGCGYTAGQGPNYRRLRYNGSYYNSFNKYMWDLTVTDGPFWDGDSGSGIFIDEGLIGVTSQRDAYIQVGCNVYKKRLYACSHKEIYDFLTENKEVLKDCGDWKTPPQSHGSSEDAPPLWKPNPNIPIYTESNTAKMVADLRIEVTKLKEQIMGTSNMRKPSEIPDGPQKAPDVPPQLQLKRPSEVPDLSIIPPPENPYQL